MVSTKHGIISVSLGIQSYFSLFNITRAIESYEFAGKKFLRIKNMETSNILENVTTLPLYIVYTHHSSRRKAVETFKSNFQIQTKLFIFFFLLCPLFFLWKVRVVT